MPGEPVVLLACRYHGFNQPQPAGSLASSASFAPIAVSAALNSATVVPKGTNSACPPDFGEVILLRFGYSDHRRLDVNVDIGGCGFSTNGDRTIFTPMTLLAELQARLGRDHLS